MHHGWGRGLKGVFSTCQSLKKITHSGSKRPLGRVLLSHTHAHIPHTNYGDDLRSADNNVVIVIQTLCVDADRHF